MSLVKFYICSHCGDPHKNKESAHECCPRSALIMFRCAVCQTFFSDEARAWECCGQAEENEADKTSDQAVSIELMATFAELEAAGQQRLIP